MAPFCIEPLDKRVERGWGSCQKAHFQGALAPPTSGSSLAAWGEWGHVFPVGWVPVMLRPCLTHRPSTGRVSVTRSHSSAHSLSPALPFEAETVGQVLSGRTS